MSVQISFSVKVIPLNGLMVLHQFKNLLTQSHETSLTLNNSFYTRMKMMTNHKHSIFFVQSVRAKTKKV
jgi:hypothetical protein